MMAKTFPLNCLALLLFLGLASCQGEVQVSTRVPSSLTAVTPGLLNAVPRTATPTFMPITPEPTATALFRAKRVSAQDYGQNLTLFIGDTFTLSRLAGDDGPLTIDNQHVLQPLNNPRDSSVILKAIGIGKARVSSLIIIPCPNAPMGCAPPQNYLYLNVTVVAP